MIGSRLDVYRYYLHITLYEHIGYLSLICCFHISYLEFDHGKHKYYLMSHNHTAKTCTTKLKGETCYSAVPQTNGYHIQLKLTSIYQTKTPKSKPKRLAHPKTNSIMFPQILIPHMLTNEPLDPPLHVLRLMRQPLPPLLPRATLRRSRTTRLTRRRGSHRYLVV
jgi:hypothetical protein